MSKKYEWLVVIFLLVFFSKASLAQAEEEECENPAEWFSCLENIVDFTDEYDTYSLELPDGTVSAKLFQFYDGAVPVSYVVVSNEISNRPEIIEFGEGYAQSILGISEALEISPEKSRLLYLGNLQYILEYIRMNIIKLKMGK